MWINMQCCRNQFFTVHANALWSHSEKCMGLHLHFFLVYIWRRDELLTNLIGLTVWQDLFHLYCIVINKYLYCKTNAYGHAKQIHDLLFYVQPIDLSERTYWTVCMMLPTTIWSFIKRSKPLSWTGSRKTTNGMNSAYYRFYQSADSTEQHKSMHPPLSQHLSILHP